MNSSLKDLAESWHVLMRHKKIHRVYNRIPKELISPEDMKRPEIESVKKNGYYDVSDEISEGRKNGLEDLVSLGYVEKKKDTLYRISYMYVVHPYHPFVLPPRGLVITGNTNRHIENVILLKGIFHI